MNVPTCHYCEAPIKLLPGIYLKGTIHVCESCQDVQNTMAVTNMQRAEVLDQRIKRIVNNVFGNSATWNLPTDQYREQCPQWDEIRDSFMRAIFAVEREQKALEIHAEYVVENCL